ncbi:HepT-like ribonuclease domain-containing protein [Nocardioides terrae]|nr:HepT-like ribonuclease domain-containing protein [Nocardioides terrae]
MLAAIERCQAYAPHLDVGDLSSMAYDAILRNLAVLGEAVRALPEEARAEYPDVPWPAIAGLRNVVIHEYFRVDPDVVRDIVENQLAPFADQLRAR